MRITRDITLAAVVCCVCDITFAMPDTLLERLKQNGDRFHCPNGHSQAFTDPENARLRRQLKAAQARVTHAEDQQRAAERQAAAYKGHATRLRNRVGRGVCPCCNRTFANVAAHMQTKHPDYAKEVEPS